MNYINKGKRDILIIPKFKNANKLQEIRMKYDELVEILPPHITLAFPFRNEITNKKLKEDLERILKDIEPFKIKCKGIVLEKDSRINLYYIFLNVIEGKEVINNMHEKIYQNILYNDKSINYRFIPHITLGATDNSNEKIILNDDFEALIDKIIVESIGENEESNIEFEIQL